jgi:hypothetical protein
MTWLGRTSDDFSGLSGVGDGRDEQAFEEARFQLQGLLNGDETHQVDTEESNNQNRSSLSEHELNSSSSTHSRTKTRSTSSHSLSRSSSSASSDDSMAQQHFEKPLLFRGLDGDDPNKWVERYEEAVAINNWNDAAKVASMIRSLEGPARKWYVNVNRPDHW